MSLRDLDERITNIAVHNLANIELDIPTRSALGRGLKFIPTPRNLTKEEFDNSFNRFERSCLLRHNRQGLPFDPLPFYYVPTKNPSPVQANELVHKIILDRLRLLFHSSLNFDEPLRQFRPIRHNMTRREIQALISLCQRKDIIIRNTDKNLGLAIFTHEWHNREALQQLSKGYVEVTQEKWKDACIRTLDHALQVFKSEWLITLSPSTQRKFLDWFNHCRDYPPPRFYLIPKVHKPQLAGRPISANHSWIFKPFSIYLDKLLLPFISTTPSYLRNSGDLIPTLRSIIPSDDLWFVTGDVESLYPSINLQDLQSLLLLKFPLIKEHATKAQVPFASSLNRRAFTLLVRGLLLSQHVCFNDRIFRQTTGIPMGTQASPQLANFFMHFLETSSIAHPPNVLIFKRYIDDYFILWRGERADLQVFLDHLQSQKTYIKINWNLSTNSVDFLDLHIFKLPSSIGFCTHQKELNKYLYIPFSSFHPPATLRGWIKGELIRYCRNSSSLTSFENTRRLFFLRLRQRGYPPQTIVPIFNKVLYSKYGPQSLTQANPNSQPSKPLQVIPKRAQPLVLVIPMAPNTIGIRWPDLGALPDELQQDARNLLQPPTLLARSNPPTLGSRLF